MHCRKGHGRTGTTATILSRLLQSYHGTKDLVTQSGTLASLREQRAYLCETPEQYRFVTTINEAEDMKEMI